MYYTLIRRIFINRKVHYIIRIDICFFYNREVLDL